MAGHRTTGHLCQRVWATASLLSRLRVRTATAAQAQMEVAAHGQLPHGYLLIDADLTGPG